MSDAPDLDHSVVPFACPSCEHRGEAARMLAGRTVPCPACDAPVPVSPPLPRQGETLRVGDLKVTDWLGHSGGRPPA